MVNELAKYSVFSTFDLRSAYHQIKIAESNCKPTAFEAKGKLFEFTRIPFGAKNGVAACQRTITEFVERENLKGAFPYLDNVTNASKTQAAHGLNVNVSPSHPSKQFRT